MNPTTTAIGKPFWKSPLFPMVCAFLVLGPTYLWWPDPMGPSLLLWLPVFLLMISMQVHENTQRLERLERMLASREGQVAHSPNSEPGAVSS